MMMKSQDGYIELTFSNDILYNQSEIPYTIVFTDKGVILGILLGRRKQLLHVLTLHLLAS